MAGIGTAIEFDVQLSKSDLRKALFAWQFQTPINWLLLVIGLVMLFAGGAQYVEHQTFAPAALGMGALWIVLPFILPLVQINRATRGPDALTCTHYQIDENGIRRTTKNTAAEMAWGALYGFRKTADAILVLTNKRRFFVIPQRSFADEAEFLRITVIVSSRLRKR